MKPLPPTLAALYKQARAETPFGPPRNYGFADRLRASLKNREPRTLDFFNTLCWRFSMICLPLIIPALIALTFSHRPGMSHDWGSLFSSTSIFAFEFLAF
jgi:hypothetical protein